MLGFTASSGRFVDLGVETPYKNVAVAVKNVAAAGLGGALSSRWLAVTDRDMCSEVLSG
jgi:hypothetical protein